MAGMSTKVPYFKIACLGCFSYAVLDSLFQVLMFSGSSMEPTIHDKDIGLGTKLFSFHKLRRGDIITTSAPDDPSMIICKRIVALEGDKVTYSPPGSQSFANEEDLSDLISLRRFVPKGHVWVEGDNSSVSCDSRIFGPLPTGLIRSRVVIKLYPFRNFAVFAREPIEPDRKRS